ncbi:kelch repeat-containing protein [Burkholderia mayonis]|uniref:kelch repeat-containing protein n=1 Tax=Burkholderia mayonis TaxID=1385591 RepID=UPI00131F2AA0|nr:kelch repeat-containing protein [Burkholderia mayonis]
MANSIEREAIMTRGNPLLVLVLLLVAFLAACGGSDLHPTVSPPAGLNYSVPAVVYDKGAPIIPNLPHSSGGSITKYSVLPALPSGLALDPVTGVISGTPSAATPVTVYVVTGSNSAGSVTARVQIEVEDGVAPPDSLSYQDNPVVYAAGAQISPNMPTTSGGEITQYAVAPALPAGLALDPQTGIISGTPTTVTAPANYTVTGSNSAGSAQTQVSIEVRAQAIPPTSLTYSDPVPVYVVGQAITQDIPQAGGGAVAEYAVSPTLPAGLSIDAQTGVISGTPQTAQTQTIYTVTAGNSAGNVTAQVAITVTATAQWLSVDDLAQARHAHTATRLLNGKVLVAGGANSVGGSLASAELYDPATNTWSTVASMNQARSAHTATLLPNGKVLVAGGVGISFSSEVYDPVSDTWTVVPEASSFEPSASRSAHTATLLPNGKVMIAGGVDDVGRILPVSLSSVEVYDPANNAWAPVTSMNHARSAHTATRLTNGKVLVAGGVGISFSSEVYDPVGDTWTVVPEASSLEPSASRSAHTATLLPNGKVMIAGGVDDVGRILPVSLSSVEVYDPANNAWAPVTSMNHARSAHTATPLTNGKVLVAGGRGASLSSAEVYDPANNAWTDVASLNQGRAVYAATLLPDGRVLVEGGHVSAGGLLGSLSSAEVYMP